MTITKRAPRLSFKTIGEETIVLDTKINKEVHKLDEVGTFIWNLLDGNRSINGRYANTGGRNNSDNDRSEDRSNAKLL